MKKPKLQDPAQTARYWQAHMRLAIGLLSIWFAVSFGAGILFRDYLDMYHIGGAPLGFWMSQQGAIYVFVILIFIYTWRMGKLDEKYGIKRKDRD